MLTWTRDQTLEAVKGVAEAADFIEQAVACAHFWDDLIDRDKDVSDTAVNQVMTTALLDLPANRFYQANFAALSAQMRLSMLNWRLATRYEREGGEYERHIAYILRSAYVDLIVLCAQIVGGDQWALDVADEVRRYTHREGYEGYLANLQHEHSARAAREGA